MNLNTGLIKMVLFMCNEQNTENITDEEKEECEDELRRKYPRIV